LRAVIAAAGAGDRITFASGLRTIALLSGQIEINKNLTITGPGINALGISGNSVSRVFVIDAGVSVAISDLTIGNGNTTGAGAQPSPGPVGLNPTLTGRANAELDVDSLSKAAALVSKRTNESVAVDVRLQQSASPSPAARTRPTGRFGEDKVFCGRRERQVGPEDFYNSGGEAFPVTDLTSALLALRVITEQGEGLSDSIFDSDDRLFGEDRQVAHYFRFNEILTGRTYGPHDTPDAPPTGPEIDVRWEDAYLIDPNAAITDYARYEDKAVYEHAVAFKNTYAELLAHLEIAFNGMPRFMILAVPTMLHLRDLAERLYHNPHPDPAKGPRGYFASATFEIDHHQLERGHKTASAKIRTARLNTEEPVDLSRVEP